MNLHNFLNTQISILAVIDLLKVDHDVNLMYSELSKLKKDYYDPTEKIIILHNDTEYFYYGNKLGFTTHNLFTCLRSLDIPYHVIVILTNHNDLNLAIAPFIINEFDQPIIIPTIVNNVSFRSLNKNTIDPDNKNILFPAMCLLGVPRNHRIKIFQYLKKHELFNLIKTNYNSISYTTEGGKKSGTYQTKSNSLIDRPYGAIFTFPHRINESCFQESLYPEIVDLNLYPTHQHNDPDLVGSIDQFYNKFFLDIVAETVFDYPHVFVSEKTLKPLLFKSPFILFGAAGTLAYLKQHGFKTFNNFWDESYDNEVNPHLRFLKCCHIIHDVVSKPLSELQLMYQNMKSILDHNHATLVDYIETQYKPLYNKINL